MSDKPRNPWAPGTFFLQQREFCVKIHQLHSLLHKEGFMLQNVFFFYFIGIILAIPAGYMQKFERKLYICFWKWMVLCHGTDFLKQKQFSHLLFFFLYAAK